MTSRTDNGPDERMGRALPRAVVDQVRASGQIIAALRSELAESRKRNVALVREHQETLRSMARMRWVGEQMRRADADRRRRSTREQGSRRDAHELREENAELRDRCERLERALAARNAELRANRAETSCLDEMVQELQAIVQLLDRQLRAHEEE